MSWTEKINRYITPPKAFTKMLTSPLVHYFGTVGTFWVAFAFTCSPPPSVFMLGFNGEDPTVTEAGVGKR